MHAVELEGSEGWLTALLERWHARSMRVMFGGISATLLKRIPKLYGLHSFADPRCCSLWSLSRQHNIRVFLQECAELEDYNVEGMPIWCTLLVHENRGFVVSFYTIEESAKHSLRPFCDQCRCTGKARILFSLIV